MKTCQSFLSTVFLTFSFFSSLATSTLLLQGFNWESSNKQGGWYNSLLNVVPELASAGVTHVWLPPPSHSVSAQGSMQNLWPFPADKMSQGYAYILTHPGIPSVFYDHFFNWGKKDEISKLSAIRKRNSITETSKAEILAADADLYVAKIDDKIITKIGPKMDLGNLIPPDFQVSASGIDYAVWEKQS